MKPGVKICGLNDPQGVHAARDYGATYLGFVFFNRSPRYVTSEQARALLALLDTTTRARPQTVGLFVKADDDLIASVLDRVMLDVLQIYDTPARGEAIRKRFKLPVWLSCGVTRREDLPGVHDVNGYIIEPRAAVDASRPGGNGQIMDWSILRDWSAPLPWMLAGGLTPDNVGRAMARSGAVTVDVSTGVETSPGVKSAELIRTFIKNAHSSCTGVKN